MESEFQFPASVATALRSLKCNLSIKSNIIYNILNSTAFEKEKVATTNLVPILCREIEDCRKCIGCAAGWLDALPTNLMEAPEWHGIERPRSGRNMICTSSAERRGERVRRALCKLGFSLRSCVRSFGFLRHGCCCGRCAAGRS